MQLLISRFQLPMVILILFFLPFCIAWSERAIFIEGEGVDVSVQGITATPVYKIDKNKALTNLTLSRANDRGVRLLTIRNDTCSTQLIRHPNGSTALIAISPYVSKASQNPHRVKLIVGPAAMVNHIAATNRARKWDNYE
ncbi:MAG: hypothetical protein ABFD69_06325 [Candidatus Sumerlaeia bacterium]